MSADHHDCPHCGRSVTVEPPAPDMEVLRVTPYSPHSTYDARMACEKCNESLGIYYEVAH